MDGDYLEFIEQTAKKPVETSRIAYLGKLSNRADLVAQALALLGGIDHVFTSPSISSNEYREMAKALKETGATRILLVTWGWWLGPGAKPKAARVIDQVACHAPGPLTGSPEAARGEAFVGMRNAYDLSGEINEVPELGEIPDVVLWHTAELEGLSEKEREMARMAECSVASPYVAPWASTAAWQGMKLSAVVLLP